MWKVKNTLLMLFLLPFACADVIHTVGPIARGHINSSHKDDLANCYKSSLKLMKENNIRSVVSTFMFLISHSFQPLYLGKQSHPKWGYVIRKTKVEILSNCCASGDHDSALLYALRICLIVMFWNFKLELYNRSGPISFLPSIVPSAFRESVHLRILTEKLLPF